MEKQLCCICCPRGCRLTVMLPTETDGPPQVSGHACPRGAAWGAAEALDPRRILTVVVATDDPRYPVLPVRSDAPVPLPLLFALREAVTRLVVRLPVSAGTCLLENPLDCGARIVASRSLPPLDREQTAVR